MVVETVTEPPLPVVSMAPSLDAQSEKLDAAARPHPIVIGLALLF
jgi:hypothetical protein